MSRYDIEKFDPPPDPDLVCCICQCVLDQAVECPCRHVFCQSCIERWLTNRHTCPTCRKRTMKPDLKPVLPLVQNMLNRLLMICDYRDNGCLDKIMLENYENHVRDCGYEMKKCRFIKCGEEILKMNLERHEGVECEHRESLCGGECGLMIALSDRPTHVCMDALKAHIDEKNRMIETLKSKLHELNNLSQSLNDQLEQLRQQLDENRPRSSLGSFSGSDTDVTEFMSDQESFFDDSSDSFDQHLSDNNNTNNNIAAADNINNDNVDTTAAVTDNEPVNDVMEQFEVTVVNSLFDLSSRLERVRDEMRTVLNTGTPADSNNLTENLGMRSARIDDIIDNLSRSINDTSVHSDRTGDQGSISSNGLESNRIVSQVNATVEHGDTSPGHDELNNNVTDSQNDSDREPHSDHSYSAASSWQSPEHHTYSDRSPHSSDRSRNHSYTPPYDLDNLSHSSTSDRNSVPLGTPETPDSYRRYSDRNSGSLSPTSDRYSEHRSNVSNASSRSQTPTPRYSRYDPEDSPRTGSAHRSLSPSSDRSNRSYNRSWSNSSLTPRNSSGRRSDGSLSPRSPASGNWSSDNWNSDDGASERSRHSEDNWSHMSRSTLSHKDCVSDDEKSNTDASHMSSDHHVKDSDKESEISDWCTGGTRTPVSEDRNSNSGGSHMSDDHHRKDSDRESAISDWCTGGTRTPAGSPRHSDSDCEMASRTPTSDRDFKGQSSDHMTSPSQSEADSDCGSRTPQGGTSSEESLPTPVKIREHSDMSDSSPASHRSPPWRDTDESDIDSAVSENNSPYSERKKSCTRRSRLKNKGQRSPAMETIKTDPHEVDLGRNKDKFKSKTSGDKRDVYSSRRHSPASVGVNSGRVEGKGCRPNVRNDKDETQMSASDSGVFSASNSSEINPETISRNTDRKRKAEKESALSTRSKRNRSAAVSLNSHQIIPGSSTTIQTSVPQSGTSPSNVNVKIDLSLYNISGQLIPQTNTVSSGGSISNSGCSVIRQAASSHSSSTSPMKTVDNTKNVLQRQRMTRSIHTRSTTVASGKLEGPNSKSASQNKDTTEKHVKKQTGSDRQRSSIPSFANRDFPNSWCDDSDSESDQTWLPGSDKSETDDSLTEDEEILSDSSYEVVIPKTAKDLLEEYKSDDTDESWTPS